MNSFPHGISPQSYTLSTHACCFQESCDCHGFVIVNVVWELSSHEVNAIQSCTFRSHHIRVINRSASQADQRSRSPTSDLHLSLLSSKSCHQSHPQLGSRLPDMATPHSLTHSQGQILGEHPASRPVVVPPPLFPSCPISKCQFPLPGDTFYPEHSVTTLIRTLLDNTEPPHQNQKGQLKPRNKVSTQ